MSLWLAFFLLSFGILTRLAPIAGFNAWPWHFAALTALALCGGALVHRPIALFLPVIALALSDLLLNLHYGASLLDWTSVPRLAVLFATAFLGSRLVAGGNLRLAPLLTASVGSSIAFYLVTNSVCWWSDPGYAKTMTGWGQALSTGLPGYPPTWTFLRNSLIGDLGFSFLFYASIRLGARSERPSAAPVETVAHV